MKKLYTLAIMVLLTLTISPKSAEASWWNPFTWFTPKVTEKSNAEDFKRIKAQIGDKSEVKAINTKPELITKPILNTKTEDKIIIPEPQNTVKKISEKNIESKIEDVKDIPVKTPTDPRGELIAQFLKEPTLEKFKSFCEQTKNIEGKKTKQVLDSTRENITTIKLSMYEDFFLCNRTDIGSGIFYVPLDERLLVPLENSDTDEIRTMKILYNNQVKSVISTSKIKFTAFVVANLRVPDRIKTPTQLFDFYKNPTDYEGMYEKIDARGVKNIISDLSSAFK